VYALASNGSPDGQLLATGRNTGRRSCGNVSDPRHPGHERHVSRTDRFLSVAYALAFSPDGRLLATGGGTRP